LRDQEWKTMKFISWDPKSLWDRELWEIESLRDREWNCLVIKGKKFGLGFHFERSRTLRDRSSSYRDSPVSAINGR
jgi:hypothetical protein